MKRREAVVAAVVEEVGIKSFGGCWLITDNTKGDQKRSYHSSCSGSCGDGRPYTGWTNSILLPVIPCHHLSLIDQKRKEKDFNVFLWPAWGEMEKASTDRPIKEEGIDQELHWEHFIILCWSIYIFQLDGAWALWGNISRPQVPDERLNSYNSWLIYFSVSPHFFRRQNDVLLQCGGAAIKSRHCTIVRSLSQMCWVLGLQFHMSSIWNYLLEYVLKLTVSKWIGFGNMVPLADQSIMEEKGERWKVLSLTHVEYKVANHDLY